MPCILMTMMMLKELPLEKYCFVCITAIGDFLKIWQVTFSVSCEIKCSSRELTNSFMEIATP